MSTLLRLSTPRLEKAVARAGNAAQQRVLEAAGWKKLAEFENTRSGETTELWGHNVKGAE